MTESLPEDVIRALNELEAEIDRVAGGQWDLAGSTSGGKDLRSRARTLVLAAQKVKESVTQHTYSPR